MINLALAVLAFVGGHFLLSSRPVRTPVAGWVGERAFFGLYSALMIAALAWLAMAFRAAPLIPLWSAPPAARLIPVVVMPLAGLLLVGGLTGRNPTMILQSVAPSGDPGCGRWRI